MTAIHSPQTFVSLLRGSAAFLALALPAAAQAPEGGIVRSGSAVIGTVAGHTVIRQESERAIIDWRGFDVGRDHAVRFEQPGPGTVVLNRIGSGAPSRIEGRIEAPGTVILQNEAGVLFTRDARVDVGGLVATSGRVDPAAFAETGRIAIGGGGLPGARVVNEGDVTIGAAGLGALVGRDVENAGTIVARRGTVALASGEVTTIDLAGDGIVRIAIDGADAAARVTQSGRIDAGDGRVLLSAGAASAALGGVVNTTGTVRAGAIEVSGGTIRIGGALDASRAGTGGRVDVGGRTIGIEAGARIDASGTADGGTIRIGGDVGGTGPRPRARTLDMAPGASVAASGGTGRGGSAILWADGDTRIGGSIDVSGAAGGGFAETSGGERLHVGAGASVTVGAGGRWLLDPRDVTIVSGSGSGGLGFTIDRDAIVGALRQGNVTVTTAGPGTDAGTISVEAPIVWSGSGDLTLLADRDIRLLAPVRTLGGGTFRADALNAITVAADLEAQGAGGIALIARGGDLTFGRPGSLGALRLSTEAGLLDIEASKGSVLIGRGPGDQAPGIAIASSAGTIRIRAGESVEIAGGTGAGQWVRIGEEEMAATIQIQALRIALSAGTGSAATARVLTGAGGSIGFNARDVVTLEGGANRAVVAARGGSSLSLRGTAQVWNGTVAAGTGAGDGGAVTLAGAIDAPIAPVFDLMPGRSFVLEARAARGLSSLTTPGAFAVTTRGTGIVNLAGPVQAASLRLVSAEAVTLGPLARLATTGAGDALVVAAGRRFGNGRGADALAAPGGRWLLFIDDFGGIDGARPASGGFDLYGRLYGPGAVGALPYGGNRIVWGARPELVLSAASGTRTYGGASPALGFTVSGLRPGDRIEDALLGPVAPVASAGLDAAAPVAAYATAVFAEASAQGYALRLEEGSLDVTPAPLAVTAQDAERREGEADPPFAARFDGFVLGETEAVLGGTLAYTTQAGPDSPPGDYALSPAGLESGNYAITFIDGVLSVLPRATAPDPGPIDPGPGTPDPGTPPPPAPAPAPAFTAEGFSPLRRGSDPLTPGDASFRTTPAEAPPALSNPFALGYSLGEISGFAPAAGTEGGFVPAAGGTTGTEGFVPAAGGADEEDEAEGGATRSRCRGVVRLPEREDCALVPRREDYWTTREDGLQ